MQINDKRFFVPLMVVSFLSFSVSVGFNVSAQQRQPPQTTCPATKVACPDSVFRGGKLMFTADVRGGDQQVTPTFNWAVSAGSIESGQGTTTIHVDTSGLAPDSTVTATVDVGGFDRACGYGATSSSCTTTIASKAEPRKLDEYGALKPKEESARLDNFVVEMKADPQAQGYVIAYGGRASRAGDARKAAEKVRDYLVSKGGLEAERVMIMDGGYRRQPAIELWVVPSGAEPPQPTPSVEPGEAKPSTTGKPTKTKTSKGRKS
jgi:hypothetical protein